MLTVGQNRPNGQHLTRFDSNPNQFNILNSYFGSNSVFKNCLEYQNIGFNGVSDRYRHIISGYGYHSDAIPLAVGPNRLVSNFNEWPTIEESFGAGLQPQRTETMQWPQTLPGAQTFDMKTCTQVVSAAEVLPSFGQWTTSFWKNIDKMTEGDGIKNPDINNNGMDCINENKEVPSNRHQVENQWNSYRKAQQPIGYHLKKPRDNVAEQTFGEEPNSQLNLSSLTKSWYVQPKVRRRQPSLMECVFCKNNNERPEFYRSHILKDPESNIQCPVLRAYDCPICHNGGGPKAHTIRYCPLNKAGIQSKLERLMRTQALDSFMPEWPDIKKRRKAQRKAI